MKTENLWRTVDTVKTEYFSDEVDHYLLLDGDLDSDIKEKVLEINPQAKMDWVYEDTDLEDEKENGPLLIKLELFKEPQENSLALLEIFHTQWMKSHLGITISTPKAYSNREIKAHLQQLRYVNLADTPAMQKVHFRWYEPRGLLGLFEAFNDTETQLLLGNIQQLIWCEWTYDKGNWYQYQVPEEKQATKKPNDSTLNIQIDTIKALDNYDFEYYLRCLTRELISNGKKPDKITEKEMLDAVRRHCNDAYAKGFSHEDDVKQYINLHLQHMLVIQQNKTLQNTLIDESIPTWQRLQIIKKHLEQIGNSS